LSDYHIGFSPRFGVALHYVKGDDISIDVHWHLIGLPYSRSIDIKEFWLNAVLINIDGVNAKIFSPEDFLIHLVIHVSIKECYSNLLWLVDIAELIDHKIDWDLLLVKIQRYKIHFPMYFVLNLIEKLFGVSIPSYVLDQIKSYKATTFEEKLSNFLVDPRISGRKGAIADFLLLGGIKQKGKYISGKLFPGSNFMRNNYSNKSVLGAYLTRTKDVFTKGVKAIYQASIKHN
jgi:hypothetical protein